MTIACSASAAETGEGTSSSTHDQEIDMDQAAELSKFSCIDFYVVNQKKLQPS